MISGSVAEECTATIPIFKVAFLGDTSVGKTSIVQRFYDDSFSSNKDSTIGASFIQKKVCTENGVIQLNIWDTAGQERFRSLVSAYTRGCHAAIICFSCELFSSFENVDVWIDELNKHCSKCLIVACQNKSDLENIIPDETVNQWSHLHKIPVFKTSAKTGAGIEEMFGFISNQLVDNMQKTIHEAQETLKESNKENGNCC